MQEGDALLPSMQEGDALLAARPGTAGVQGGASAATRIVENAVDVQLLVVPPSGARREDSGDDSSDSDSSSDDSSDDDGAPASRRKVWSDAQMIPDDGDQVGSLVGGWAVMPPLREPPLSGTPKYQLLPPIDPANATASVPAWRAAAAERAAAGRALAERDVFATPPAAAASMLPAVVTRKDAPQYVGERGRDAFFRMYRDRVPQRNGALGSLSPRSAYLARAERGGLVPAPFGVVRRRGRDGAPAAESVCIPGQQMGDEYALALGASLAVTEVPLRVIDLRGNRLTCGGLACVVRGLLASQERRRRAMLAARAAGTPSHTAKRSRGAQQAGAQIASFVSLTSLDLSDNQLGDVRLSLAPLLRGSWDAVEADASEAEYAARLAKRQAAPKKGEVLLLPLPQRPPVEGPGCVLKVLRLSRAGIDGASLAPCLHALEDNHTLRLLDLSHNDLGTGAAYAESRASEDTVVRVDGSSKGSEPLGVLDMALAAEGVPLLRAAAALARLVIRNTTLSSLGLAWCGLSCRSATLVLRAIARNTTLETLDLCWNAIGSSPGDDAVLALANALNPTLDAQHYCYSLKHLDISHNRLSRSDCECLAEALRMNRTLLGLHVSGNECYIDARGRIKPVDTQANPPSMQLDFHARILEYPEFASNIPRTTDPDGCCWLCDRWTEITFKVEPKDLLLLSVGGAGDDLKLCSTTVELATDMADGDGSSALDTDYQTNVDELVSAHERVRLGDQRTGASAAKNQGGQNPSTIADVAERAKKATPAREEQRLGLNRGQGGAARIVALGCPNALKLPRLDLHLSCDSYAPHSMVRQKDSTFELTRMVPPFNPKKSGERSRYGALSFFFSTTFDVEAGAGSEGAKADLMAGVGKGEDPFTGTYRWATFGTSMCALAATEEVLEHLRAPPALAAKSNAMQDGNGTEAEQAAASAADPEKAAAAAAAVLARGGKSAPVERAISVLLAQQAYREARDAIAKAEAEDEAAKAMATSADAALKAAQESGDAKMIAAATRSAADLADEAAAVKAREQLVVDMRAKMAESQRAEAVALEAKRALQAELKYSGKVSMGAPLPLPHGMNELYPAPGEPWFECVVAMPRIENADPPLKKAEWSLPFSVFGRRAQESDSGTFWDDDGVLTRAFHADYGRTEIGAMVSRENQKVVKATRKEAKASGAASIQAFVEERELLSAEDDLEQVMGLLREHFELLTDIFICYSAQNLQDPFTIGWNSFRDLVGDCSIAEPLGSRPMACTTEVCDSCFIMANQESTAEEKALDNSNKSLCRYELMEVVVRVAIARYGLGSAPAAGLDDEAADCLSGKGGVAAAVRLLIERHIVPNADHFDNDDWRDARMYNEGVHKVLRQNTPELRKVFTRFCKIGQKRMTHGEWQTLLARTRLIDSNVTKREGCLSFLLAKMLYIDDMKVRVSAKCPLSSCAASHARLPLTCTQSALTRTVPRDFFPLQSPHRKTLSFVDFLEAVARVTDMRFREGDLRFRAWDHAKEGEERPLAESMRELFTTRLLAAAGSKRMKKAIRGNLMAMLAIRDGPAKLKQLMEAKMNAAAKAK